MLQISSESHSTEYLSQFYRAASALVTTPRDGINVDVTRALEAAAAGLPIIGLYSPALRDLFDSDVSDFFVPVEKRPSNDVAPTLFGWSLATEQAKLLRPGLRPGRQNEQIGAVTGNSSSSSLSSSSGESANANTEPVTDVRAIGTAMQKFVAHQSEAQQHASTLQEYIVPLLGMEASGGWFDIVIHTQHACSPLATSLVSLPGLARRKLEDLITLSMRQNFSPRRKKYPAVRACWRAVNGLLEFLILKFKM